MFSVISSKSVISNLNPQITLHAIALNKCWKLPPHVHVSSPTQKGISVSCAQHSQQPMVFVKYVNVIEQQVFFMFAQCKNWNENIIKEWRTTIRILSQSNNSNVLIPFHAFALVVIHILIFGLLFERKQTR